MNVDGAWALSLCLEKAAKNLQSQMEKAYLLNDQLFKRISAINGLSVLPESRTACDSRFSPWIIKLTNNQFPGEVFVRVCDDAGLALSTGSACSSGKGDTSVLEAMGIDKEKRLHAFRLSFGPQTSLDEIHSACDIICTVMNTSSSH